MHRREFLRTTLGVAAGAKLFEATTSLGAKESAQRTTLRTTSTWTSMTQPRTFSYYSTSTSPKFPGPTYCPRCGGQWFLGTWNEWYCPDRYHGDVKVLDSGWHCHDCGAFVPSRSEFRFPGTPTWAGHYLDDKEFPRCPRCGENWHLADEGGLICAGGELKIQRKLGWRCGGCAAFIAMSDGRRS